MDEQREQVLEQVATALKERAKEGRVACREAFAVAEALGVPLARVGEAANAAGIKICGCQLGCFK
ncbi:MAG: hypothetical protein ACM3RP_10030 [Chitinophagales bacterium]